MRFPFLRSILFFIIFSSSFTFSQLPEFFYQLPYSLKIDETDESELAGIKDLILDTTDYSILNSRRYAWSVDYRIYRWECELYCYIDTATAKLQGIKIWNTTEIWETNGIKIGMMEKDFLHYLKNNDIKYSSYKCKYFNDYTVETARLSYSFSFPAEDEISSYADCQNDIAHQLEYVYVSSFQPKRKPKAEAVTY